MTQLIPLVDAIPSIAGKVGHPVHRPEELLADRAYDSDPHREPLAQRGLPAAIAKRHTEHGSGRVVFRRVLARTIRRRHQYRRQRVSYERRADINTAFQPMGCIGICHRHLMGSFC